MKKWITLSLFAFVLASCHKETKPCPGATDKNFAVANFNKVSAGETFTVTVSRGSNYGVLAQGCADDLADLDVSVDNNHLLNINYSNYRSQRNRVDFTITLPTLTAVQLSGASKGTVNGFKDQLSSIRTVLSGNAHCTLNGAPIIAQLELSGNADFMVTGTTENLYGNLSGNAALHAYEVAALEVDIDASGNATAYVAPTSKLFAAASGNSRIYYKGNPAGKLLETTGNGKIIKE